MDAPDRVRLPIDGVPRVTQWYGANPAYYKQFGNLGHPGIDFGLNTGTPLKAVADGTVSRVQKISTGYGWNVMINHGWGETIYAHMSRIDVSATDKMVSGQIMGLSGNTGNSTGPHLHFGMRIFGQDVPGMNNWIDPAEILGLKDIGSVKMDDNTKLAIRNFLWNQMGVAYNPGTALAKFAKEKKLGAPKDGEQKIPMGGKVYVIQPFDGGIAAVAEGDWANVELILWN